MTDDHIQQWKIKKLIQRLENARGNGTSMISLIIPPKDSIPRYSKMLTDEYGTASNIKSRVNRLSVLSAITSTQQKLKLYRQVPTNGLIIYCGTVITDEGKEKKVNIDLEPHQPINTSLYLCDNKFHTECLKELLQSNQTFGFIVMDGNGTLYGTVSGNTRYIIHQFNVDLPKKHNKGGQSSARFGRIRQEKRHAYVCKVAEFAKQFFIDTSTSLPNVKGIVLAGSAEFKNDLASSDLLDGRLSRIVVNVVDVSYGGENGFNQAIDLASETLAGVKLLQEKKLLENLMDEIVQDTGKYSLGVQHTLYALEAGAVQTLLLWEDLNIYRYKILSSDGDKIIYSHDNLDNVNNVDIINIIEKCLLVEYLTEDYKKFGCHLEFITDASQEAYQFVKGFGGIGGILRYPLDFSTLDFQDEDDDIWEY